MAVRFTPRKNGLEMATVALEVHVPVQLADWLVAQGLAKNRTEAVLRVRGEILSSLEYQADVRDWTAQGTYLEWSESGYGEVYEGSKVQVT